MWIGGKEMIVDHVDQNSREQSMLSADPLATADEQGMSVRERVDLLMHARSVSHRRVYALGDATRRCR